MREYFMILGHDFPQPVKKGRFADEQIPDMHGTSCIVRNAFTYMLEKGLQYAHDASCQRKNV